MLSMNESTIFKPIDELRKDSGVQSEISEKNPVALPPPPELPSEPPPSMIFKVLKIILGIAVVLGIIVFVYNVILPKFFPGKINQVKLLYWGVQEDASVFKPIIADFEKAHPNIKVEYVKLDKDQYIDKLITRSNIGNGPDIFQFHSTWTSQLSNLLQFLPESVISKEDFSKNYYPAAKADLIRNGAIYGIPLQMDTLNLYMNRDLLQAAGLNAPTSWIEFGNHARQMTVKGENNSIKTAGAAMGTYNNITHAPSIISMLFVQNGVNLEDMSSGIQAAGEALRFYSEFAQPSFGVWNDTLDESIKSFASGTLAMYFGYSWDFFTIKSMNPNLVFDIYPVPSLPGRNVTIANYWVEGVSSKTRHQKEAFLFMRYLARKETAQKLFSEESKTRNFGEPHARADLAESLKGSFAYPFVASASDAVSSFFVDGTKDDRINSKMNNLLNIAVDSVLKGAAPQAAAENLSGGVTQTLRRYGR